MDTGKLDKGDSLKLESGEKETSRSLGRIEEDKSG